MDEGPDLHQNPSNGTTQHALRRVVVISNPDGLHMRPAAAFAEMARRFECQIQVLREDRSVNGKSWLDLLTLVAGYGSELTIEVTGADANEALDSLAAILAAPGIGDSQKYPKVQ